MIVLARFISPAMITTYEINKRPLGLTNSLIGRHSVALMPLISHSKGTGEKGVIIDLINKQFKFYLYAALFAAFIFALNYSNLITLWVGEGKFIGNNLLILLLLFNFFTLLSYFMSNVGYALGDIKKNSAYLIARNICFSILVFLGAKFYGIAGTVAVSLTMTFCADLFFFTSRVYKLGYLQTELIKKVVKLCVIIIPVCIALTWLLHSFVEKQIPEKMYLVKMVISTGIFTLFFLLLILVLDSSLRNILKKSLGKSALHFT